MSATLVTGGAGFIGSALVRFLTGQERRVVVLDDLSSGSAQNLADQRNVELIEGSVTDIDAVRRAMSGVDVVFHLACKGVRHSIHDPLGNHRTNATGTLLLLEEALAADVERFVYTSSSEVYGTAQRVPMDESHPTFPTTVYGGSKLAGEAYVRAYNQVHDFPTVVIRPFNAFGPRSHHEGDSGEVIPRFIVRAMNGLPLVVFGDGKQTRDFTYVEDTARGIAAAAEAKGVVGHTINLGSGTQTSVLDLARIVLSATSRTEIGIEHELPRPGDVRHLVCDSSQAGDLLNWQADVGLEDGLEKLLAWHRQVDTDWGEALKQEVLKNWEREADG